MPAASAAARCCPAVPAATATARVPARPGHLLPGPPRRGRSAARPPDVPRLLRLPSRGAVQRGSRGPVAPLRHLPAAPPGPRSAASPASEFRELVRVRFVKVAEYQARGVVHFHAIIRLDANTDDGYCAAAAWAGLLTCWPTRSSAAARRRRRSPRSAALAGRCCCGSARRPTPGSSLGHQGDALTRRCGGELHRQVRHQDR